MFTETDIQRLKAIYRDKTASYMADAPHIASASLDALADIATRLASEFTLVTDGLPMSETPVIAIRRTGYASPTYELITARYQPSYRPNSPWRMLGSESVHDSGEPVLAWRYADGWFGLDA